MVIYQNSVSKIEGNNKIVLESEIKNQIIIQLREELNKEKIKYTLH